MFIIDFSNGIYLLPTISATIIYLLYFFVFYLRKASLNYKWEEAVRASKDKEDRLVARENFRNQFLRTRRWATRGLIVVPIIQFLTYLSMITDGGQFQAGFMIMIVGMYLLVLFILFAVLSLKKEGDQPDEIAGFKIK